MALSMLRSPLTLPWAPLEAAERPEKRATIPVAAIWERLRVSRQDNPEMKSVTIPNFLPILSDRYPIASKIYVLPSQLTTHQTEAFLLQFQRR